MPSPGMTARLMVLDMSSGYEPSHYSVSPSQNPDAPCVSLGSVMVEIERAALVRADSLDDLTHGVRLNPRVDGHGDQRMTTLLITTDLHTGDVDAMLTKDAPEL